MHDLATLDPGTLVVGSSHARTFHYLSTVLHARHPSAPRLVAVPLEGGKLTGYEWLMAHRILPLVDERDASGRPRLARLRRFIVVTEWWDSCRDSSSWNLPARAWGARDYVSDVAANGFTERNRNYLRERARHAVPWSVVVQRRGTGRILRDVLAVLRGTEGTFTPAEYQQTVERWRRSVEQGASCIGDPLQMRALRWTLQAARRRGLEVDVVLFPRKPDILTPLARTTTLARFADLAREVATSEGARLFDLTTSTPLTSQHFLDDFDHISPKGNAVFADWALDHALAFLASSSETRGRGATP
jgi:hypothetical protein